MLFLCNGNSCRSQMAEAIVNARHPGWQAFSAGVQPAGYVHPLAIRVLVEIGIQHTGESKSVDQFRDRSFDRVITVCDEANEQCPVWLGSGMRLHESFPDPARAAGTEEQRLLAFRRVRDAIIEKLPGLLGESARAE
ncbi:MAG TPA: arsenate reductase ArsC [Anaerolineales bacterium]